MTVTLGVSVKDNAHAKVSRTIFYGNDYAVKCYEKVSGQGGGHAEVDSCIIAESRKAAFEIDRFSSINFTKTLCDQQPLPGADNLQGTPVFEDIGKDLFNCIRITRTDNPSKTSTFPVTSVGANIDFYPTRLPLRKHAKSNLDST
jgi:hypothetical protein